MQSDDVEGGTEVDGVDEAEPIDHVDPDGISSVEDFDTADESDRETADEPPTDDDGIRWGRLVAYGLLPALALLLALGAGFLKWQESTARDDDTARIESVQAAKDSTAALLSYQPDTVDQQLDSARNLLIGDFRDAYAQLVKDVVIPGAKEKRISAVATVPAVSSVYATKDHAVALVFVNQTTVVGTGAPTGTASSVRVTMDKVDGRWLISQFDPV